MPDFDTRPEGGPGEFAGVLVSRSDIARLAGVKRPAVTNWERRYAHYPAPVSTEGKGNEEDHEGAEPGRFRADEVLAWLSGRVIPANALRPGEPTGTTYGDRFRAGLTGAAAGGLLAAVRELTGPGAERIRGPVPLPLYLDWLLYLVFCAIVESDGGTAGRSGWSWAERDDAIPEEKYPRGLPAALQDLLDRNPPSSPEESRQAFDLVLTLLRDAGAREGGDFLTPPSVSRVMAGALAAVAPAGTAPHDPYCRTGELLTAYLDAAAERGRSGPHGVSGRVPQQRALRLARMNLRVLGVDPAGLAEGPVTPTLGEADPPAAFDAVITNPPFGARVPVDDSPDYWTYGPARYTEFDWLQYVVSRLAPGGRAAVLMPGGAAFTGGTAHGIRVRMVDDGAVECVMALPGQLFERTAIRTHIWFLRSTRTRRVPDGKVLFVDGEGLGHGVTRTRRALSDDDIKLLVGEYTSWCRAADGGRGHPGTPGLSRAVTAEEIAANDHRFDPALYVRDGSAAPSAVTDPAAAKDRLARLSEEIGRLHAQARTADLVAEEQLRRYGL